MVIVNNVAVISGAVVNMAVGAVWYSKMLFGKQWSALSGVGQEAMKKGAQRAYLLAFISALVLSYVLAHFIAVAGARSFVDGAKIGFWTWLGFVVTTNASDVIFAGKKPKLYQLNMGYNLVSLILMGAVIAMMGY